MTDIAHFLDTNYSILQAIPLLVMGLVMVIFGASVLAQQYRAGVMPRLWRMPGGWVGGIFLIVKGCMPLHMAASRFGFLPWSISSWQATVIYFIICVNAVATLVRWWRFGFEDNPPEWDGVERRSGRDRRKVLA